MTPEHDRRHGSGGEKGFTYVMLMFSIVVIGISLSAAAVQWKTIVQREKEADLLAKGLEIQNALALYSAIQKAGRVMPGEIYPTKLEDLTKPPRPTLRKVYLDPMEQEDWDYVRGPNGGISGVRSRSTLAPFKQHDFPAELRHFDGLTRYQDWIFQHPNPSSQGTGTQGIPPGGTAPGSSSASSGSPSPF